MNESSLPDLEEPIESPTAEIAEALREWKPVASTDPTLVASAVVSFEEQMEEFLPQGSIAKARETQEAIDRGKALQLNLLKKLESEIAAGEVRQRRSQTVRSIQNVELAIKSQEDRLQRLILSYVVVNCAPSGQSESDSGALDFNEGGGPLLRGVNCTGLWVPRR
jgi:hypothetical protein